MVKFKGPTISCLDWWVYRHSRVFGRQISIKYFCSHALFPYPCYNKLGTSHLWTVCVLWMAQLHVIYISLKGRYNFYSKRYLPHYRAACMCVYSVHVWCECIGMHIQYSKSIFLTLIMINMAIYPSILNSSMFLKTYLKYKASYIVNRK